MVPFPHFGHYCQGLREKSSSWEPACDQIAHFRSWLKEDLLPQLNDTSSVRSQYAPASALRRSALNSNSRLSNNHNNGGVHNNSRQEVLPEHIARIISIEAEIATEKEASLFPCVSLRL